MRFLTRVAAFFLLSLVTSHAQSLYELAVKDIDGKAATLAPYQGRVLLIVNVASECGFTPQYQGLESLFAKYQSKGLTVLARFLADTEPDAPELLKAIEAVLAAR